MLLRTAYGREVGTEYLQILRCQLSKRIKAERIILKKSGSEKNKNKNPKLLKKKKNDKNETFEFFKRKKDENEVHFLETFESALLLVKAWIN
jgi:hypothetical protein